MTDKNILVLLPVAAAHKKKLEAAAPGMRFRFMTPDDVSADAVKEAHAIIGNLPFARIPDCAALEWLHLDFAGVGKYGEPGFLPENILLSCSSGAYGEAIGEYLTALLLAMMKKLYLYRDNQRQRLWQDMGTVRGIMGSRILVVGLGDIGMAFARRAAGLGAEVVGIRRHPGEKPDYIREIYTADRLDSLLPEAEAVVMCLPDTPLTGGLINRGRLLKMKKNAYFLNVGRGNVVDNLALAEVLAAGHLAGAAMDVTEPEPLPADHPLWTAPNMLITPHVSGKYHMEDIREKIVEISCANLRRYLNGQPLLNLVDKEAGYRRQDGQWAPGKS